MVKHESVFVFVCVANFEAKYLQLDKFGEGGFGSDYAGNRKTDNLPVSSTYVFSHHTYTAITPCTNQSDSVLQVAIKHIPKADLEG